MASPQPKATPSRDSHQSKIFGICDHLARHGHCTADVVLAPAKVSGEPDWDRADPANVSALPGDQWPEDEAQANRACVIVSNFDGCDPDSTFIVALDPATGAQEFMKIHGPESDRDVAESILCRDLGERPKPKDPSRFQASIAKLTQSWQAPAAANDNTADPRIDRLKRFKKRYGGEMHMTPTLGPSLYGCTVNGERVNIGIGLDDEAFTFTVKGGRQPLAEVPALAPINPAQWDGRPIPPRQWYIPDLIPMRQVTLLYGDGGVGKSLLALQIAAAGALSVSTLGLDPWAGRVLYLGAEDEDEEFQRRLSAILAAHDATFADLHLFRLLALANADALLSVPDKAGNMQPTPLWLDIVDYIAEFRPRLIVLDTVADLFAGDEIKRGQARQFVGMLRKVAIDYDCAIILLAHPSVSGMTSGTGTSGSTGWSNSARSRLYLTRGEKGDDPDLRVLKTMKANYGTVGGEMKLKWQDGAFVLDDGTPSVALGLLAARAERIFREALSAINRTGERVAKTKGVNYAPKLISERPEAKGLTVRALEAAMQSLLAAGEIKIVFEGPPSKQRQRLILTSEDFGPGG